MKGKIVLFTFDAMDQGLNCSLCSVPCASILELHRHLIVHFQSLQGDIFTVVGQLSGFLGATFTNVVNQLSKPFQCTQCTSSFDTRSQLLRHGASHLQKIDICPTCSREFGCAYKFLYAHECVKNEKDEPVQKMRSLREGEIERQMGQDSKDHVVRGYKRRRRRPTTDPANVVDVESVTLPTTDSVTVVGGSTAVPLAHMQSSSRTINSQNDLPLPFVETAVRGFPSTAQPSFPGLDLGQPLPAEPSGSISINSQEQPRYINSLFESEAPPSFNPHWNCFVHEKVWGPGVI
ncbi:hypothetical protein V2G26_007195 [Clonostachys chloroleuca]